MDSMLQFFLPAGLVGLGVGIGFLVSWRFSSRSLRKAAEELNLFRERNQILELKVQHSQVELQTRTESLQSQLASERSHFEALEARFSEKFENLANTILEKKSHALQATEEKNLKILLAPLRDQIKDFEKKMGETYEKEATQRLILKKELEDMVRLNEQMSRDARNLTEAIKGDSKQQGNWGEMILERLLEASGLRKGEEYTVQGTGLGLKDENGRVLRPDVVIHLPEEKHIIVDSKVSITSYERFVNSEDSGEKSKHLKAFLASVQQHVDELSRKNYQALEGVHSPDFVFMFMQTEGAFSLVVQSHPEAFYQAWEKRIVIVSPTTLQATLRTVASIWKQERQNRNALEIARQGGQLYDKFVGFLSNLEELGKNMDRAQDSYQTAVKKLKEGRGNLISRTESLRKLGAKTTKKVPRSFVVTADSKSDSPSEQPLPMGQKELFNH